MFTIYNINIKGPTNILTSDRMKFRWDFQVHVMSERIIRMRLAEEIIT